MSELSVPTRQRTGLVDITRQVEKAAGGKIGTCLVFARHTTCGILCCTPADGKRMMEGLELKVPSDAEYQHGAIDSNAHAHLKAILAGCEKAVPSKGSGLALPKGCAVYLAEFDGPHERSLEVLVF